MFINQYFKNDVAARRDVDDDRVLIIFAPEEDQNRVQSFIELLH